MSALISNLEYDIFVSYRHNDNRSGWVTEFVNALQEELAATIKESITVYFDTNQHDSLLETYNVDKSLEGKLKCFILIPIISQTYCDTKSFAWQHEFVAFNKLAKADQFGRDITLSNGNVTSRILPIKIHEVDEEDKALLQNELDGVLRGIDFIFIAPGVNRPLTPFDNPEKNQNKTFYRDQINKVANAIKEIIYAITKPKSHIHLHSPLFAYPKKTEKSIMVLPFVNMSNDPDQEYFSDGLTEEIITDLTGIHGLLVISRSSAMTFKGTKKKIAEIATEIGVQYVLEGSVRKAGNDLRISAQLIRVLDDSHLWAERYNGKLDDIFGIQEKVSRSILNALRLKLSVNEDSKIAKRPIENARAYELYLKAQYEFYRFKEDALIRAIQYLEAAIEIVGENVFLYGSMGFMYLNLLNISATAEMRYLEKAQELAKKIFDLQPDAPEGHSLLGFITAFTGSKREMLEHLKRAYHSNPNDPFTLIMFGLSCFYCGLAEDGEKILGELNQIDPFNPINRTIMALVSLTRGNLGLALEWSKGGFEKNPEVPQAQLYYAYFLGCNNQTDKSYAVFDKLIADGAGTIFAPLGMFLKYAFQGDKSRALESLTFESKTKLKQDCEWSWLMADGYALIDEKDEALNWIESIVNSDFINYPLLSQHDPFLENIRDDKRFRALIERVKNAWENLKIGHSD